MYRQNHPQSHYVRRLPPAGAEYGLLRLTITHVAQGFAAFFLFQAIQIHVAVEVVAFVLKHTAHQPGAPEHDLVAVQ